MNSGLVLALSDGRTFPLMTTLRIGRDATCQIVLNDVRASRVHATVWVQQGVVYVRDENSMNGTTINGVRIPGGQPVMLHPNDQMSIGGTGFQMSWAAAPVAAAPVASPMAPPPVWTGAPVAPRRQGSHAWLWVLAGLGALVLVCVCVIAAGYVVSQSSLGKGIGLGGAGSGSVSSVAPPLATFGKLASVASKPVTATVNSSASTMQLGNRVSIQVPAGAFAKPNQLEATRVNVALDHIAFDVKQAQFYVVSTRDEVGTLGAPVILEVPISTTNVTVVQFDGKKWQPVKVKAGNTTRLEITHFSKGFFGFLEWFSENQDKLDQALDTSKRAELLARNRQKIENGDQWVRAFYGAGEKANQSYADTCNGITTMLASYNVAPNRDFPFGSILLSDQMALFLHAAETPSGYGGYFNDLVKDSMDEIRRRVIASSSPLSPAEFLRISIAANGGNVPRGVLAAHNFLKEITYRGRDSYDGGYGMPRDSGEPAAHLQSWRQGSNVAAGGYYDKMGPLYHIFAAMTAGLWLPTDLAGDTVAEGEAFLRTFRVGADRADLPKAEADQCGVRVAQWLRDHPPAGSPDAGSKYAVFLLTNVLDGTIWLGQESDLKGTTACRFSGEGTCKGDGTDPKVVYQKKSDDFPTREEAVKAYCAALQSQPQSNDWGGFKANIYGGTYWITMMPACPAKK